MRRTPLLFVLVTLASGCDAGDDIHRIVEAAVAAHGGRARIDALESVTIESTGRFRDRLAMHGTMVYRDATHWSVDARAEDGASLRFGIDAGRCWRVDRHLVRSCSPEDRANYDIFADVLGARIGRGLTRARFTRDEDATIEGAPAPALRAGELVYVFDPETHLLAQIRHGDAVEALSGYERVQGVRVATRRMLTIGGEPDVDDRWDEVTASGPHAGTRGPPLPRAGATIDYVEPERWVLWTDTDHAGIDPAIRSIEEFARAHDRTISGSEGIVLTALEEDRWRVAVTVDRGTPSTQGAVHFERWPPQRMAGRFHSDDPPAALATSPSLLRWLDTQGLTPADGARWQIVTSRAALGHRGAELSLLRIAVQDDPMRPPSD